VALARALIADTGLILCDEPLSNLDADLSERMRVEISALVREAGATTVYITHDQAEAFALADHIGGLEEGVLVQYGTPEDIYNHPATPFVARFTGLAGELLVKVVGRAADGTVTITAAGAAALPRLRAAGTDVPASGAVPATGAGEGAAELSTLVPGAEALLAIRPTGISLARSAADEQHLTGLVADVAFRGRGYEYAIDLPGLGRLTGIFARHRANRSDEVSMRLEPEGCHLFAVSATAQETVSPASARNSLALG
jgi:iron(III) transport system ATP-binding protein